jgi:hypothetical protein
MSVSFKNYLVELHFAVDDLTRIMRAFQRRLPALLGSPIYRDGGSTDDRQLFFFADRAFQVRSQGGHIQGIDVWTKYALNKGPSYTIDVHELNSGSLLKAMGTLARLIKNPSEGTVEVKQIDESQLSEMAKRVADDSFYTLMVQAYGEAGARDVTWEQIKKVADENDVLIPAYIRSQKIGRGRWNSTPGAAPAEAGTPPPAKKDPILYIKVTAQDPDSKKFIPSGANAAAQALYQQIQGALEAPPPAEDLKDPDTLYGHLAQLVGMATKGTLRSLLVYGGPGTGKTYTIMQTVNDAGLVKGVDYVKLSGKASPIEIYKTLFMFRNRGLVIFDDLDSMWGNEDATNILKAALDSSPVREISWVSSQTINVSKMDDKRKDMLFAQIDRALSGDEPDEEPEEDDDEEDGGRKRKKPAKSVGTSPDKIKYPSTFDFKGRVIFISNLRKEEFDSAIMSRSAKINMDLSAAQILDRMRKILPTLGGDDVTIEQKEELLDHLLTMHKRKEITAVTMREFTKGLDIVRSGAPNWKELVQYA